MKPAGTYGGSCDITAVYGCRTTQSVTCNMMSAVALVLQVFSIACGPRV